MITSRSIIPRGASGCPIAPISTASCSRIRAIFSSVRRSPVARYCAPDHGKLVRSVRKPKRRSHASSTPSAAAVTSGPMPSPPITPIRYVFTVCGWCRKRDDLARGGRSRLCLRKRRNDLSELVLGESAKRFRCDVPERAGGKRESCDDVVTRRLGDEDEVVSPEREVQPLQRAAGLLGAVPERVDATRPVFELRNALLRVARERDERGHGTSPCWCGRPLERRNPALRGQIRRAPGLTLCT